MALMKVIQMLGSGQLDHKTAGLMLYALQTASNNLRNTEFEAEATDVAAAWEEVRSEPELGGTSPEMARSVVLLPAPLAPMRATNWPAFTSSEIPLRAVTLP